MPLKKLRMDFPVLQTRMEDLNIYSGENIFRAPIERKGHWSFICSTQDIDSDGLTEYEIVWKELNNLHEKNPEIFQFPPDKTNFESGFALIMCYTPNYRDEEFITKIANIIRKKINYPFIIYYKFKKRSLYLHTPNGELYENEDKSWKIINSY
ncbi:uncharacterized protein NPIL_242571 [Nephila pilipes]|uniref:DUF695 domain-containing protein n=1 Tax=Nephila pilipes TaxID=299642 RepID=A0A8X6U939_NEPPI|nr:uncharacterized protein NPIL_242571 [Nephila pilipes]